jgi:hypothetical protein
LVKFEIIFPPSGPAQPQPLLKAMHRCKAQSTSMLHFNRLPHATVNDLPQPF